MNWISRSKLVASSLTAVVTLLLIPSAHAGPSVTVVNTNSCIVANTTNNPVPVVIAGTLNVGTSTNAPLLVRDVDNPARQSIVRLSFAVNMLSGDTQANATVYTVPAGKRLVIEFVSLFTTFPPGQKGLLRLTIGDGSNLYDVNLVPTLVGTFTSGAQTSDISAASQQTRFYANAGDVVLGFVQRNDSTGPAFSTVTVEGYLADVP